MTHSVTYQRQAIRIIEFVGISGSGKTTLATALAQEMIREGYAVVTRTEDMKDTLDPLRRHARRMRFVLFGLIKKPGLFVEALRLIFSDGQRTLRDLAKVSWNLWCVLGWYLWLYAGQAGQVTAIADQGLFQALWSIRFTARRTGADWKCFLRDFGLSEILLVEVQASSALARHRLATRDQGNSRIASLTDIGKETDWQRGAELMNAIVSCAKSSLALGKLLRIENGADTGPEAGARKVLAQLYVVLGTPSLENVISRSEFSS